MKLNFNDFGRKCQFPVTLAAGCMAVLLLILAKNDPESIAGTFVLAGLYVLLSWLCIVLPGKMRIPAGVVLAAGLMAAGALLLPVHEIGALWILPAAFSALLLGGLQMAGWSRSQEMHPMASAICLVAHLVAQFLVNTDKLDGAKPTYEPIVPALTVCFLVFAAMSLLALNRISLNNAVNGQQAVPTSMRRRNRLMNVGLMAITLLVAALPAVIRAIEGAWQWLTTALMMLVRWIMNLFPETDSGGVETSSGAMEGLTAEIREQGLFSKIMEIVMLTLAVIAVAVGAFFALRVLWRKLKVLTKYLWERLNAYMQASSEDYVDEVADTRDGAQAERALSRLKRRMQRRRVDENALSPRERIRYRYLMHWMKHPEWTPERTVRENLCESEAQIYERARYSSHEVTAREAENFARNLDASKNIPK